MVLKESIELAKAIILWLLIIWFVIVNTLVLLPSIRLLIIYSSDDNSNPVPAMPPKVPETIKIVDLNPKLDSGIQANLVKNMEYKVSAYTQDVTAYTQQLTAYKAYLEFGKKNNDLFVYEKVVKDVLASLLSSVMIAFLGFAGIQAAGVLFNDYLKNK